MDVLKEEEQKITLDIDEFINRRAKEGADLAKALSDIEDANDTMVMRVRCIDAETEILTKEREEIKVALMKNAQRHEGLSLKKRLMEEDMDIERREDQYMVVSDRVGLKRRGGNITNWEVKVRTEKSKTIPVLERWKKENVK